MKGLDCVLGIFLIFWVISVLFSIVAAPVPTDSAQGFAFLHILANTCCLLITDILTGMKWHLFVVLICISLMISHVEHLFIYQLDICMSSMEIHQFFPVINWAVWFSMLNYMSSLHIFYINCLSGIWFANMFSHSLGCLFILLLVSFILQKLLCMI